jgi:uncharacterized protein YycO
MIDPSILKTGDILHCSGTRVISKLIKAATRSEYSHTALFIWIWDKPYVIDAQKDGVNTRPWDEWVREFNYTIKVSRSSNKVNEKTFATKALSKSGNTAYDLEGLLLRQPYKLITGKWKEAGDKEERMFCSEYVAWVYGIKDSYKMTPQDLYDWCVKNGFYTVE